MLTWDIPSIAGRVVLSDKAERSIRRAAKRAAPRETGGTLVGHYAQDNVVVFIDTVLVAKRARSARTWFVRPSDEEDRRLDKLYDRSNGKLLYLGEWHTHPGAAPEPSPTDERTLLKIAVSEDVACKTPLLMILGGDFRAAPSAWVVSSGRLVAAVMVDASAAVYGSHDPADPGAA